MAEDLVRGTVRHGVPWTSGVALRPVWTIDWKGGFSLFLCRHMGEIQTDVSSLEEKEPPVAIVQLGFIFRPQEVRWKVCLDVLGESYFEAIFYSFGSLEEFRGKNSSR
ncbi:hypothetical protein AVEN_136567-1 [Araneus ventricosus]|uniref:Uncharacterized protein n=1 Tax=Araneus ventricosus TaxID=182803 RepID=A0A4Y2GXG1_ARAVE|nr:hypothetical protein AVEN_136567-1 [Araneus ventricosus]